MGPLTPNEVRVRATAEVGMRKLNVAAGRLGSSQYCQTGVPDRIALRRDFQLCDDEHLQFIATQFRTLEHMRITHNGPLANGKKRG